jgi:hypothetical protein
MCVSSAPSEGFTGDPSILDVPGGKPNAPAPGQQGASNFDPGKLFGGIGSAISTVAGIAGTILGGPVGIGLRVASGLHTAADVVHTGRKTGWSPKAMAQDKLARTMGTFGGGPSGGKKTKLGQ